MSNVVKIADKKKKPGLDEWRAQIEEHGDNLMRRIYDAVRLADEEANDEDIPEEYVDCMILGVLTSVLVAISNGREVVSAKGLLALVNHQIEGWDDA
jgi:hypothetical protein